MGERSTNPASYFAYSKISLSRLHWIYALQHIWPNQHEDDCVLEAVGLGTGETDDVATILDRRDG
jgi:hypothetical protein